MTSITLTGLDAKSLPLILNEPKDERSSWVEFGILWSEGRAGVENRYPVMQSIVDFSKELSNLSAARPFNFALHVCGRVAVQNMIRGDGLVTQAASAFDRIQINFNYEQAEHLSLFDIRSFLRRCPTPVIFQMYSGNARLFADINDMPNVHVLIDGSGGRGISPKSWRAPVDGFYTGYAGGLGPLNLAQELKEIDDVCPNPYWVDMEGKLRDEDDWFSLERAQQCIEIVSKHRQEQPRVEHAIPR